MKILLLVFGIFIPQLSTGQQQQQLIEVGKNDYQQSGCCDDGTCSKSPFLQSPVFRNGKRFLVPWNLSERKGDWWQNLGYCNKYCAEMVTIQSDEENNFLHWWLRSAMGMVHPGAWLGAQIFNASKEFRWQNNERVNYNNPTPGEYNEGGTSCLHVGWDNGHNKWWNYYCTPTNFMIVCQRWTRNNYGSAETQERLA